MASALTTSPSGSVGYPERAAELHLVSNVEVQSTVSVAERRLMRVLDVIGAVLLLLVFSPVLAVVAILVKRSSPGPIIFRQERIGRNGVLFDVFKFRSMADGTDAEILNDPELRRRYEENDFKLGADDPRITPIGRFIRKTSLDELPQLFNVLRGEMSLVGVRPLLARACASEPVRPGALCAPHPGTHRFVAGRGSFDGRRRRSG